VTYKVERIEAVERDLDLILDFLTRSHLELGESADRAWEMAADRMRRIHHAIESLGDLPHTGTLHNDLLPGLRSVTRERAIFYFKINEEQRVVTVLAVFFGGQDHLRHMIARLRSQ
jgi:toxin ParE1/3/4